MTLKERAEALRLRAGAMWRERKERIAEKRAARHHRAADQLHGHTRFWLLNIPATATVLAAIVEVYWALLFCIEATGNIDANFQIAQGSTAPLQLVWDYAFSGHIPVLIGLACATAPIVMISMVWLPVQFAMRGFGRWRRGSLIAVGLLANAIVIVSGTVVMNTNRQEHIRDALVTEQRGDASRAALVARRDAIHQRWATLTDSSNTTLQAQAARAGVAGWDAYIATARQQATAGTITPERLALIERARGSAVAAEAYQHDMDEMTGQIAAAAPAAATAAHIEDTTGSTLDGFAQQVGVWRPVFVAVTTTLIGILGAWWVLAMLEGMNPRDVLKSGWADEGHRIEDLRTEEPVAAQPMQPMKEKVYDAESGEELVKVKPHWRKLKKGRPQKVDVTPEIPPDETGVAQDGGARIGTKGEHEPVSVERPIEQLADGAIQPIPEAASVDTELPPNAAQETHSEISDEAALDAYMAAEQELAAEEEPPEPVRQDKDGAAAPSEGDAAPMLTVDADAVEAADGAVLPDDLWTIHDSPPRDAVSEPAEQPAADQEETQSADSADDLEHAHRELPETDPARLLSVAAE